MQNFTPTVNFMHLVDHWNSMDYCADSQAKPQEFAGR